ncbi:MAG: hypothetical protein V4671_19470 [Armatimonadota bacterium]
MKVVKRITLADVRAAKPEVIYYGAMSCWWTHDPSHVGRTPGHTEADILRIAEIMRLNSSTPTAPLDSFMERAQSMAKRPLPADSLGGVLCQTDKPEDFLRNAEQNSRYNAALDKLTPDEVERMP